MELFDASAVYEGFSYPSGIERIAELGIVDMDLWFLLDAPFAERYCAALAKRYPNRSLIPFAKRTDNDDVACFEFGKGDAVEVIHDFADPGWEQRKEYDNFWDWFTSAIDEFVSNAREDEDSD